MILETRSIVIAQALLRHTLHVVESVITQAAVCGLTSLLEACHCVTSIVQRQDLLVPLFMNDKSPVRPFPMLCYWLPQTLSPPGQDPGNVPLPR